MCYERGIKMINKPDLQSRLVENARSQARQPLPKSVNVYKDQVALNEEKIKGIHERVENLRKKHAKLLEK